MGSIPAELVICLPAHCRQLSGIANPLAAAITLPLLGFLVIVTGQSVDEHVLVSIWDSSGASPIPSEVEISITPPPALWASLSAVSRSPMGTILLPSPLRVVILISPYLGCAIYYNSNT